MNKSKPQEERAIVGLLFFPGFYDSILSSAIGQHEENTAEYMAEKECSKEYYPETYQPEHLRISASEYCELFFDCTDYRATFLNVAKLFVEAFDEWAHENLGTPEKSFVFESMVSPREYNFTTDRVFCYVPWSVVEMLFKRSEAEEHASLEEVIKDKFTSYDGFCSFYPNALEAWLEKPLTEWDHNELGTLVSACILPFVKGKDKGYLQCKLYELMFSGNGEEDEAWAMDWKKLEEKVKALRELKSEAVKAGMGAKK